MIFLYLEKKIYHDQYVKRIFLCWKLVFDNDEVTISLYQLETVEAMSMEHGSTKYTYFKYKAGYLRRKMIRKKI